ncbi:hypothetical protein R6Q59_014265 [Mikania micrantha]
MKMSTKWFFYFLRPILFAVLMHFVAFSTLTAAVAPTGDRLALLAIKSMIKVDPQGVMTSWNHSVTNFCQWQGVTCVGNLSFLRAIWLENNSFFGEIRPEIGRLFTLRELRLDNNSFTGNIPATIMNCSKLEALHLGRNNLVGKIPDGIGLLSMLSFLILYVNILEGGIPPSISNLTLLETLSVKKS